MNINKIESLLILSSLMRNTTTLSVFLYPSKIAFYVNSNFSLSLDKVDCVRSYLLDTIVVCPLECNFLKVIYADLLM